MSNVVINQRDEYLNHVQTDHSAYVPSNVRETEYFCKPCGNKMTSTGIPSGWYIVRKSFGSRESLKTVAIVCSLQCLMLDTVTEAANRLNKVSSY